MARKFFDKKKRLKTQATDEELLPWMDYLHGDVVDGEFEAACQYEYARESHILRKAAELLRRDQTANAGEISFKIEAEFQCGSWFIQPEWSFVWECSSFPAKSWNQLDARERGDILPAFSLPANLIRPLRMNDVRMLDGMGVFNELKTIAAAEREKNHLNLKSRPKVYAIVEGWPPSIPSLEKKLKRLQKLRVEN